MDHIRLGAVPRILEHRGVDPLRVRPEIILLLLVLGCHVEESFVAYVGFLPTKYTSREGGLLQLPALLEWGPRPIHELELLQPVALLEWEPRQIHE